MVHGRQLLAGQAGVPARPRRRLPRRLPGAANQFRGLLGERGLLPVPRFLAAHAVPALARACSTATTPTGFFAVVAWAGVRRLGGRWWPGLADAVPLWAAMLMWLVLWVLYLSIVNVGQTWYSLRLGVAAARGRLPGDLPRQRRAPRRRS